MVLLISMMSVSTLGPSRQLSGRMSRRDEGPAPPSLLPAASIPAVRCTGHRPPRSTGPGRSFGGVGYPPDERGGFQINHSSMVTHFNRSLDAGGFCRPWQFWFFPQGAMTRRAVLGSFRRWVAACGRQVTFPAPGKSPKDRRGAAQDDRFTLISALPRVLHYGDTLLFGHTLFPARKI